ncbi:hypothetical protein LINPERPRIM_LOCUS26053, partial [Linum perenne]
LLSFRCSHSPLSPPYVGPPPQSKLESGAVVDDSLLPWVFSLPERRKGVVMMMP